MRLCPPSLALLAVILAGPLARGGTLSIASDGANSTEGYGSYTADLIYSYSSSTQATLTVEIKNTSPAANKGFITGIAFNNPGDRISSTSLSTNSNLTTLLGSPDFQNEVAANPFGLFDIGASLNASFLGSGNPNPGIGVGASATFTFTLVGTGLNLIDVQDFANEISSGASNGVVSPFFLVRFRGFKNGGSDKVPGKIVSTPPVVGAIPEPGSLVLWGAGAIGLLGVRSSRRRSRRPIASRGPSADA